MTDCTELAVIDGFYDAVESEQIYLRLRHEQN
jgi:hypothetical protein